MKQSPFFALMPLLKDCKKTIMFATLSSIGNQLFDLIPEILLGMAVDIVVNQKDSYLAHCGFATTTSQIVFLGALCMIAWTFEAIFQYLYIIFWRSVSQIIQHRLRIKAYEHVQKLNMSFFDQKQSGEFSAVLNDDINQLERFFDDGINAIIQVWASTAMTAAVFLYTSPIVTLCTLMPTPFIFFLGWIFQHRLAIMHANIRRHAAMLNSKIAHNISGIGTIKSYTMEETETKKITELSKQYIRANDQATATFAAFRPMIRMAVALGFVSTVVVGGFFATQGTLAVGVYSTLVFLTQRLLWPFTELADMVNNYKRAMACTKRVVDLLQLPIAMHEKTKTSNHLIIQGEIRFDQVSFAYPNSTQVFDQLTFSIPAQKTVAFVGPTGSGKSSLIKLLLKFYDPQHGTIFLDNHDIQELSLRTIRSSIAWVSQEPLLFAGTIYENIAYGSTHATEYEIIHAAQQAHADEFIRQLPNGYETVLNERGYKLSGGQRQRIAIARALVKRSPIFVFDEATSAVDNETERAIQQTLRSIAHAHTIIIIAHRLWTVQYADVIYVLDKGMIVEKGNHQSLTEYSGLYSSLWRIQHNLQNTP